MIAVPIEVARYADDDDGEQEQVPGRILLAGRVVEIVVVLVVVIVVGVGRLGGSSVLGRGVMMVDEGLLGIIVLSVVDHELRVAVGALLGVHEYKAVADGATFDVRFDANAAMRASGCLR